MHFNRKELTAAVRAATRVISKRTVQPILSAVLIQFTDKGAELLATNLDQWLRISLYKGVATGTYSAVAIDAHQLLKVLTSSKDDIALIANACGIVTVDGMVVESFSPDDFPTPPDTSLSPDNPNLYVTMPAQELQRVITQAAPFASSYGHSILDSVYFNSNEVCATDGSRLSMLAPLDVAGHTHLKAMVPANVLIDMLQPVIKPLLKQNCPISLAPIKAYGRDAIAIEGHGFELTTRLIDGEYPRYGELIPKETQQYVAFDRESMLQALAKLKPFLDRHTNVIDFDPINNTVSVDSQHKATVVMSLSTELDKLAESKVIKWRCNAHYFQEAVQSIPDNEIVILQFEGTLKPLVFQSKRYRHLLMPVQSKEIEHEVEAKRQAIRRAQAAA